MIYTMYFIWLNSVGNHLNISGYKFLSNHRTKKVDGGVGLYVQSYLEHRLLTNCMFSDPNLIQSLFVEIIVPNGKNITRNSAHALDHNHMRKIITN